MNRYRVVPIVISLMASAGALRAQAVLRPAPSSHAISEVLLSYPRPAGAPAPAPGDPAAKPLVIRLDYGQPHLRGRTLHTDSLVPYGTPWRTGANDATTLTTEVDLVLGSATLAKGKYVLFTLPGKTDWKLIVQKDAGQGATYSESNDVVRIDLRHSTLTTPVESLTMWLIPSTAPGPAKGELRFAWGTDALSTTWSIK